MLRQCFMRIVLCALVLFLSSQALFAQCWLCIGVGDLMGCSPNNPIGGDWCHAWYSYPNGGCDIGGICPAGGGGCFLPGTLVETERGMKAIEELNAGDRVLGLDGSDRVAFCNVERTYKSLSCSYYVINGKLRVTGTHPFWVDGKWVEASQIKVGDRLKGKGGEMIEVVTIEVVKRGVRVYNIEVADAHTFYVEGVLVHNKGPEPGEP